MKRITTILMATLVVLSSFAFVKAAKQSSRIVQTWNYTPGTGGTANAGNYSLAGGTPPNCSGSTTVCQISADEDADNPGKPLLDGHDPATDISMFSTTFRD